MNLILASGSPRRRVLLSKAGYEFSIIPPDIEENASLDLGMRGMCEENARLKAAEVAAIHSEAAVIGSDTLVFLDGLPIGKPKDESDAVAMLERLSGRTNTVCTGVAVISPSGTKLFSEVVEVEFLPFDRSVIAGYMKRVNVLDKAGAYAAQEHSEMIIKEIRGDIEPVMGLPIEPLVEYLTEIGLQRER